MFFRDLVYTLVCTLLSLSVATAQTAESQPAAKPQQTDIQKATEGKALALLEEVVANAQSLKIITNRVRVQIAAAELIWPRDENRARALLENSIKNLIELLSGIDDSDPNFYNAIQAPTVLHGEMIQVLVRRDPQMALDFIRSARLPQPPQAPSRYVNPNHEVQLELQVAYQLVAKNPKLALQTGLDSLDKGFSSNIVGLVSQLQSKDREGATKLANALVKKLLAENLLMNNEAAAVAVNLLNVSAPIEGHASVVEGRRLTSANSSVLIDSQTYRELFEFVINAALSVPIRQNNSDWRERNIAQTLLLGLQSLMTNIKEPAPARAAMLQRRLAEFRKSQDAGTRFWQEHQDVLQNGSVDDILALLSKIPPEMRDQLYQQAAWKAANQGDVDRARQIVSDGISNPMYRRQTLDEIDRQAATRAASEGKVDQARQMVSRLRNIEDRAGTLIQLANTLLNKGDKMAARRMLEEARSLVGNKAETFNHIQAQLQVARAYARIESAEGLKILEPIVDQINELLGAAEVLNGFEQQYYKDGELIWQGTNLSNLSTQVINDLGLLAPEQFDRARDIAGRLQWPEVRLMAQLSVAQSVLSERSLANQQIDRSRVFT